MCTDAPTPSQTLNDRKGFAVSVNMADHAWLPAVAARRVIVVGPAGDPVEFGATPVPMTKKRES